MISEDFIDEDLNDKVYWWERDIRKCGDGRLNEEQAKKKLIEIAGDIIEWFEKND